MQQKTLKQLLSERSLESQQRIEKLTQEIQLELKLSQIREALEISQQELANLLEISQPSVVALEKRGKDIKLSSMKRYVEAMGGKLNLAISLPTGKQLVYQL